MAEKVKIKIQPSGGSSDSLTVDDAMQQVLDFIDMLRAADLSEESEKIVWRLESAQTNSPLEVTAFATGSDPDVPVGYQARQTAERLSVAIEALAKSGPVPDWMNGTPSNVAERFFKRNMNGIGRTDITIGDDAPTTIVHSTAKIAVLSIERSRIEEQLQTVDWTRSEFGAVEGEMLSTTSLYTKPVIVIKERLSSEKINCFLSPDLAETVGPTHSWNETWDHRRVSISGELYYDSDGKLKKIDATDLREIVSNPVNLKEIRKLRLVDTDPTDDFRGRLWGDG